MCEIMAQINNFTGLTQIVMVPAACLRRVAGRMIGVAAACGMATRHTRSEVTNHNP